MKYELKRPIKTNMIVSAVFLIAGLVFLFGGGVYYSVYGFLLMTVGIGFFIYEFIRSKDKKFTFDETGFYIGDMRYSYSDIEQIESSRFKYTTYVRIIVNGSEIYKFDNSYKGAKEFVKQLTLNGVDHNLFG